MKNPNELSNEQSSEEERRSIDVKVGDLLSRMILKEVSQLGSVTVGELMENGDFSSGKAEKILTVKISRLPANESELLGLEIISPQHRSSELPVPKSKIWEGRKSTLKKVNPIEKKTKYIVI